MDPRRRLLRHGIVLFLLGIVTGLALPAMLNTRMGLAAHLEALMNGMFLMIVGLAWTELRLSARAARLVPPVLLYGTYGNWVLTLAGAVLGTKKATPIAGAGFGAGVAAEWAVYVGLSTIVLAMLFVLGTFVVSTWRKAE